MDKLRETQKEALEDFADRVSNFVQGTAKESGADKLLKLFKIEPESVKLKSL